MEQPLENNLTVPIQKTASPDDNLYLEQLIKNKIRTRTSTHDLRPIITTILPNKTPITAVIHAKTFQLDNNPGKKEL